MATGVDHLVLAGASLSEVVDWWVAATGTTPASGGAHPGMGTRNELVGLDDDCYLELIGPDPDQPEPAGPRPFGIDELVGSNPTLQTFAVRVDDLEWARAVAQRAGVALTPPISMRRELPDTTVLEWQLAFPVDHDHARVMPFLIDWGESAHPSTSLPSVGHLVELRLRHPNPGPIAAALEGLDLELVIDEGTPSVVAELAIGQTSIHL